MKEVEYAVTSETIGKSSGFAVKRPAGNGWRWIATSPTEDRLWFTWMRVEEEKKDAGPKA